MKPIDILHMTINNAHAAIRNANELMSGLTPDDAEFDVVVQIIKDNQTFIRDQEHTIGLMEDGLI